MKIALSRRGGFAEAAFLQPGVAMNFKGKLWRKSERGKKYIDKFLDLLYHKW